MLDAFRSWHGSTLVRQYDVSDCGPAALLTVLRHHRGNASLTDVRELTGTNAHGTSMLALVKAARALGFEAAGAEGSYDDLRAERLPAIAHVLTDDGTTHYVVVLRMTRKRVRVADPARGRYSLRREQFERIWTSRAVLLLQPTSNLRNDRTLRRRDWVFGVLRGQEVYVVQSLFLGSVYAGLGLLTAFFVQTLIDRLIPAHDLRKIALAATALMTVQLLRGGAGFVRQRFLVSLNQRISGKMAGEFLEHVLRLPLRFFETRTTGDITSRLNDTARIQGALIRLLGGAVIDGVIALGALAFVLVLSPGIGGVALAAIPLYLFLAVGFAGRVADEHARAMGGFSQLDSAYIDVLKGIDTVLGFNGSAPFSAKLLAFNAEYQRRVRKLGNTQAIASLAADLASGVVLVAALAVGAWFVISGKLLVGGMMAAYSLVATMLAAIGRLVDTGVAVQGAAVATSRLFDLLQVPREQGGSQATPVLVDELRFEQASFGWTHGPSLLHGIDLVIRRGRITGLMGDSGSGKTTLVKLAERKHRLTNGRLLIDGVDSVEYDLDSYRKIVGVASESVAVFRGTLYENVVVGRSASSPDAVRDLIASIGLGDFLGRFEHGLATPVGEDGRQLSAGERQVVGFVRALLEEPAVLIVDEGLNAMDARTRELVLDAIRRYGHAHAVLLISHDPSILRDSDEIYHLRGGRMSIEATLSSAGAPTVEHPASSRARRRLDSAVSTA